MNQQIGLMPCGYQKRMPLTRQSMHGTALSPCSTTLWLSFIQTRLGLHTWNGMIFQMKWLCWIIRKVLTRGKPLSGNSFLLCEMTPTSLWWLSTLMTCIQTLRIQSVSLTAECLVFVLLLQTKFKKKYPWWLFLFSGSFKKWQLSGQGDGGIDIDDDEDEEFGSLDNCPRGALNTRSAFLGNNPSYLLYLGRCFISINYYPQHLVSLTRRCLQRMVEKVSLWW